MSASANKRGAEGSGSAECELPGLMPKKRSIPFAFTSELTTPAVKTKRQGYENEIELTQKLNDEQKMHVYKKTLQALICPISSDLNLDPSTKEECVHKFAEVVKKNCKHGNRTGIKTQDKAASDVTMNVKEKRNPEIFELIRKIFDIDEKTHISQMAAAKQAILDEANNWEAKIEIQVVWVNDIERQSRKSDLYVRVKVGKVKKRTKTVGQKLGMTSLCDRLHFESHDPKDKVKVQVWCEDNGLMCKMLKISLNKTKTNCVGQYVTCVRAFSGETEISYDLEEGNGKSSSASQVTGSIRLKINAEVRGELNMPYHLQYTYLHEKLFQNELKKIEGEGAQKGACAVNASITYFDHSGKEIIDEFAKRYGIQSIYQAMTHFHCLSTIYDSSPSVPAVMTKLLTNIIAHYTPTKAQAEASFHFLASSRFDKTCLFGKDKFVILLDQLHKSIRTDLSMYRTNYPASTSAPEKLTELKSIIELVAATLVFRAEILEQTNTCKISGIVKDCTKDCLRSTYKYIYDNCDELYAREFEFNDPSDPGPRLDSLDFWHKMTHLIGCVIEEDKNFYAPIFSQYSEEWKFGQFSAATMWNEFTVDLKYAMEDHGRHRLCKSSEYKKLFVRVEGFYNEHVKEIPPYNRRACESEYSKWFEPLLDKSED